MCVLTTCTFYRQMTFEVLYPKKSTVEMIFFKHVRAPNLFCFGADHYKCRLLMKMCTQLGHTRYLSKKS
jgi:hypothetical protein